jgi:hypothetical protein
MPFTVQLDLDAEAEATLGTLAETLAGIPGLTTVRQLGDVRHGSLAIYDDPPLERFVPALTAFAETPTPFEVHLASIPLFADITNSIFLGVATTDAMLVLHRRAHTALGACRASCCERSLHGGLASAYQPCAGCDGPGRDCHASRALDPDDGEDQQRSADPVRPCSRLVSVRADLALIGARRVRSTGLALPNAAVTASPPSCGSYATARRKPLSGHSFWVGHGATIRKVDVDRRSDRRPPRPVCRPHGAPR